MYFVNRLSHVKFISAAIFIWYFVYIFVGYVKKNKNKKNEISHN